MHKYNRVFKDRFENINIQYIKIQLSSKHNLNVEHVGTIARELCDAREYCLPQFFGQSVIYMYYKRRILLYL